MPNTDTHTSIVLSDLSVVEPPGAMTRRIEAGKWLALPYACREFSGTMLFVAPECDAPPVRLRLPVTGWHHIHVGVHYSDIPDLLSAVQSSCANSIYMLRLKLDRDPCYHVIFPERYLAGKEGPWPEHRFSAHELVEVYWRSAELHRGWIEFSPARTEAYYRQTAACVGYVRLVPMSEQEIAEHKRDLSRRDTRRLLGCYDGAFWGHYPRTVEQFRELVEPLRDSDFAAVAWSTSRADVVQYASQHFQVFDGPPTRGVKPYHVASDIRMAIGSGLDPLRVMSDICREMGIELLGSMRISAQHLPPHQTFCNQPVLWSHPANRVQDAQGIPTGQLSLASQAVRDRLVDVLREQVEGYDLAGVHVMFNRSYPFVLYESASRQSFMDEHGVDPVLLDERDPRWLAHKAKFVMGFVGQIREMLDQVGARKGRRLKLCLHVMSCPRHNIFYGLDLAPAIRKGWIDFLMPHPTYSAHIGELEAGTEFGPHNVGHHSVTVQRVAEWKGLTGGSNCLLYPDLIPRRMPADALRRRAMAYYEAGADGLSFHDVYWRIHRKSEWAMFRQLGHRDELPLMTQRCADYFRKLPLVTLAGLSMDQRHNPGTNG